MQGLEERLCLVQEQRLEGETQIPREVGLHQARGKVEGGLQVVKTQRGSSQQHCTQEVELW